MKRTLARVWAVAVVACSAVALADPPSVNYVTPAAVAPGRSVDVTLLGSNLAAPTQLWTSFPATVELAPGMEGNGSQNERVTYRLNVPQSAPLGVGGLRIFTGQGVSSLRLVWIDDLPTVAEKPDNKSTSSAQELSLPTAIDAACEAESYDYYRFTAAAGQRLAVEVVARRIGSPLDPVVRLLDNKGRELAYSDDEAGLGPDSRFEYRFATAGEYLLEVRDIRYQGDATYRYRLRVGDFPLASTVFPLAGRKGTSPRISFAGPAVVGLASINVPMPDDPPGGRVPLSARFSEGQGSAPVTLLASDALEQVEFEPNDTPETASRCALPGGVNGRFEAAKDRDWYEFEAKSGERFVFSGQARSLGSASDLFLRLYRADGSQVAEADDSGADEGSIDYQIPADGVYRLMVEDLNRRGGEGLVYRIDIQRYQPGFILAVESEKLDVPQGGVFVVKVTAARRDYNGPITLSLVGAGEGFMLEESTIPEGKNETSLRVTVPPTLAAGQAVTLRIVGQAKIGDREFRSVAGTKAALKTLFNGLAYPPPDLDGVVGLGVGPVFPKFFELSTASQPVVYPQIVGSTSFKLQTKRLNKFDGPVAISVEGLPEGVSAKPAPIDKGKDEVEIAVAGPGSLVEGDYRFRVIGSASFQNQPQKVVLGDLALRVVKPLEVAVAPAGPMPAGGKQTVRVHLTRFGQDKGAVKVRWKSVPRGITVPDEIVVPEGQDEVAAELAAAADMPLGSVTLVAVAAGKVQNRDISVESLPATFEIKGP